VAVCAPEYDANELHLRVASSEESRTRLAATDGVCRGAVISFDKRRSTEGNTSNSAVDSAYASRGRDNETIRRAPRSVWTDRDRCSSKFLWVRKPKDCEPDWSGAGLCPASAAAEDSLERRRAHGGDPAWDALVAVFELLIMAIGAGPDNSPFCVAWPKRTVKSRRTSVPA
jgi:hypothetical protein